MQVQVHYQGLDHTPWMDEFITKRVSKLNRYLNQASRIEVHLKFVNRSYVTSLAIHNPYHEYAFSSEGENLYESFSIAIAKASRALTEHKRQTKNRIHRRLFGFRELTA